jgi:hypothetical protein
MIGQEAFGASFRELADYLDRGTDGTKVGRIEWLEARNVWAPTVHDGAAVMSALASASPSPSPVYHLSVSFDLADAVDRALMCRVADRLLADLALTEHQAVIVAHNDREHAHFHLMVNRVHPRTGRVWKIDFSKRTIERSLRTQERELGLRENPGHLFRLPGQARPDRSVTLGAGVLRREERTGVRPYLEVAREDLASDFADATGYADLEARLSAKGHRLEERQRGLIVTDGTGFAAVSSVSSTASRPKLEARFGESYATYRARGFDGLPASATDTGRERSPGRVPGQPAAELRPDARGRDAFGSSSAAPSSAGGPAGPRAQHPGARAAPDPNRQSGSAAGALGAGDLRDGLGGQGGDPEGIGHGSDQRVDESLGTPGRESESGRGEPHGIGTSDSGAHPEDRRAAADVGGGGGEQRQSSGGSEGRGGDEAGERHQAHRGADAGGAEAGGGSVEEHRIKRAGARGGGEAEWTPPGVEAVGDGDGVRPHHDHHDHAAAAGLDDEPGAAPGAPRRGGGDLHVQFGSRVGAEGDAPGDALADAGEPGLRGGAAGSEPTVEDAGPRFSLYEDEGVYGVFDGAGPQVYFAETRERAEQEVIRANEIVARFPKTLSIGHLREMDGAWRAARGLPQLPEPQGQRVIVDDWLRAASPAPAPAPPGPCGGTDVPASAAVAAAIALAEQAASLREAEAEVERADAAAEHTVELSASLARATADAHEPLQRLRAALREVFGEHAPAAEAGFRAVSLRDGAERAVRMLREDPRALLPHPRPHSLLGGVRVRESAAAHASHCAPMIARLDRVLRDAAIHAGLPADTRLDPMAAARRLRDLLPVQQRVAAEALDRRRGLDGAGDTRSRLRSAWTALSPPEQASVRRAVSDVDGLLDSVARRRSPGGPDL